MMTDSPEEPRSEVASFLRGQAAELDRTALPVDVDEATHRVVPRSVEPRRWTHAPVAIIGRGKRAPKVAAAVVAALLIGSVAGFAAGRGSTPDSKVTARGAATEDTRTPVPITMESATAVGMAGPIYGPGGPPKVTRLFIRTTAEQVVLRGYLWEMEIPPGQESAYCDGSGWCAPPECNSMNSFNAELSTAEAVGQGGTPIWPLHDPATVRYYIPLGQMEGATTSTWIVQTSDHVTNVRGTWADGFTDEMAPVNGWAIVAHSGDASPTSLVALSDDGSSFPLSTSQSNAGVYPTECNPPPPPPPELPPAGEEQPDDVAGADAAVHKAYETVFNHDVPVEERGQYIEDAENLKAAGDQVKQNFPEASDTVTVTVGEIRFLSKTDAALYFELNYSGGALFGKQVGYATLIDGVWKISRDTMCMVYGWGGGSCDPPPDPARSQTGANSSGSSGPAPLTATTTVPAEGDTASGK